MELGRGLCIAVHRLFEGAICHACPAEFQHAVPLVRSRHLLAGDSCHVLRSVCALSPWFLFAQQCCHLERDLCVLCFWVLLRVRLQHLQVLRRRALHRFSVIHPVTRCNPASLGITGIGRWRFPDGLHVIVKLDGGMIHVIASIREERFQLIFVSA